MQKFQGFNPKQLRAVYRNMLLSRTLDERMLILLRQGKSFFHIGGPGHEAAQTAAAMNFQPHKDWFFPYYRDQCFCLGLGYSPEEHLLGFFAKADDPASGGRQMPQHFGNKSLRLISQSSPTGTQYLQAVGTALGIVKSNKDEVVYVSSGEGTVSQGDFHEALNWAGNKKLPVIFHIEDNHYAISVPIKDQLAGGSVYDITSGYANLTRIHVEGTDFFLTYKAFVAAVKKARLGKGPTIIISDVVRLLPHSSSDDQRKYRSEEELEADQKRDPLPLFVNACLERNLLTQEDFDEIRAEVKTTIEQAVQGALNHSEPEPETALKHVYAETQRSEPPHPPQSQGESIVMVDAINHALHEEMEENEKIIVYGEDIADAKGGVFTATKGLSTRFGKQRVFNSPLAESSLVGTAIGLALYGYKPVIEIQFGDYIWPAMHQIRNELAVMCYRSNGQFKVPSVIRVSVGGYIHGGLCHSQNIEGFFAHLPGIRIVFPSNASDAKGLLKAAIRCEDPVLFLEHKGLYRHAAATRPEPDKDYVLPMGYANLIIEGEELTIVTWGMMVKSCEEAVKSLEADSGIAEIIDLRTINPLDMETIRASVRKTGKVLIVHEDMLTGGFGAEISARLSSEVFEYLDAPIIRVAAEDTHVPYHPNLESRILPQVTDIAEAINQLLEY